jgi:hypothetical protein
VVDATIVVQRLQLIPQLNAMGFFPVKKETLTGVLGTIATYLIILIQFQNDDLKTETKCIE